MKTGGLILTTGATSHHAFFDPMQQVGSISVAQRICMTLHLSGVQPIVVLVSQAGRAPVERHLARLPVVFVPSGDDGDEMLTNVKAGLSHLAGSCGQVLVTPVNVPLFSVETVKTLLACGQKLAVPVYDGKGGHPLLLGRELFPHVMGYNGPHGLRGAVRNSGYALHRIPVGDPGVVVKSGQFEQCEKIAVTHNLHQWRPVMKLRIARESAFLGPGSWQLLSLVESSGSVRIASQLMGISYSKAWKIVGALEEQAGFPVLVRKKGGAGGGESHLTAEGRALLQWYERLETMCNKAVNDIFAANPFRP